MKQMFELEVQPKIFCLVGPAGSGKTTSLLALQKRFPELRNSVSVTSRAPRGNEVSGETREFVTREEFELLIKENKLFEHEVVHGNYYGSRQSTIDYAYNDRADLIFDIDYRGALSLKARYPERVLIIFISLPDQEELVARIKLRSSISEEELTTRLNTARAETQWMIDHYGTIDYLVLNDDRAKTLEQLTAIISSSHSLTKFIKIEN